VAGASPPKSAAPSPKSAPSPNGVRRASGPGASEEVTARRVSLVLKINKELIRLCIDLTTRGLTSDPIYRE
jgi:hypothetical protein